jgi:hypothetical protein
MASLQQLRSIIWNFTSFGFAEARSLDTIIRSTYDSCSILTCKCTIPQFSSLHYAWKIIGNIDNSIGGRNFNHAIKKSLFIYIFVSTYLDCLETYLSKLQNLGYWIKSSPWNPSCTIQNIKLRPNPHVTQVENNWNWIGSIPPLDRPWAIPQLSLQWWVLHVYSRTFPPH